MMLWRRESESVGRMRAVGGGCALAWHSKYRLATERTRFAIAETSMPTPNTADARVLFVPYSAKYHSVPCPEHASAPSAPYSTHAAEPLPLPHACKRAAVAVNGMTSGRGCLAGDVTGMGSFPDLGASWYLPRLDNHIGMYLALTGRSLHSTDVV